MGFGALKYLFCGLVLSVLFLNPAAFSAPQGDDLDYDRILTILFPQTASWIAVKDLPRITSGDFKKLEPQLWRAYLESKLEKDEACGSGISIMDALFSYLRKMAGTDEGFFRIDLDRDGIEDIMYSGSSICAMFDITFVWFGGTNGYAIRQTRSMLARVLRIAPGNDFLMGSVEIGCCAVNIDKYAVNGLNSAIRGEATILKRTVLPTFYEKRSIFSARAKELVLRSSPAEENGYDKGWSAIEDSAVFGNIIAKYLQGARGAVLGTNGKRGGDSWYFVMMDDASNGLRFHNPYDRVNVGWVKASSVTLKK